MNENLSYNGVVTLIHRVNNKVVSEKRYNSGTINLFEAYARALCGQSISRFVPKRVDVGMKSTDSEGKIVFTSKVKNGVSIPVLTTYKEPGIDGGEYKDGETAVPYCRVSVTLFPDMFNSVQDDDTLTLILKSNSDLDLAIVDVSGLAQAINDTSVGIQLILLWDLYIVNGGNE